MYVYIFNTSIFIKISKNTQNYCFYTAIANNYYFICYKKFTFIHDNDYVIYEYYMMFHHCLRSVDNI